MKNYLIQIFTRPVQTKFHLTCEEITNIDQLHKKIVDYLGKNRLEWKPNNLRYTNGYYITYEEVEHAK